MPPELTTDRLLLRPMTLADAGDIQRLAGDYEIARMLLNMPHPYGDGLAEQWISTHLESFQKGTGVHYAITREQTFLGVISLMINPACFNAAMGYWLGKPYWGHGYCTEAARAVIQYGFEVLNLNRIWAIHFKHNPASGRVMQKIGMKYEGCLREQIFKEGMFIDEVQYGILRSEYLGE